MVDARRERAAREVQALRELPLLAPLAEGEPPRRAREPGVQHHALAHAARAHPGAGPFDPRHHLVSQHLRERDQGRHRIVEAPVQEHLLVVAAAEAAELRAQHHPVWSGEFGIRDLAQPDRGERPEERPRREPRQQLRRRQPREPRLDDERAHGLATRALEATSVDGARADLRRLLRSARPRREQPIGRRAGTCPAVCGHHGLVTSRQPASGPPPAAATATRGSPGTWRAPPSPQSCTHASCRKP